MTNDEYYNCIKDKHFWYFTPPTVPERRYEYVQEEHSWFLGLFSHVTSRIVEVGSGSGTTVLPDVAKFNPDCRISGNATVPFYYHDGEYYLDVMEIFKKCPMNMPLTHACLAEIAEELGVLLPSCIMGEANLWIFNKFGATFKDIEHFCRFVKAVDQKTGNTVVLAEA